jgi:hypothetical protein
MNWKGISMAKAKTQNLTRNKLIQEAIDCIQGKTSIDEAVACMKAKGHRLVDHDEADRQAMRSLLGEGRRRLDRQGDFGFSPVHLTEMVISENGKKKKKDYWKKRHEMTLDERVNEVSSAKDRLDEASTTFRNIANYHAGIVGREQLQLALPFDLP